MAQKLKFKVPKCDIASLFNTKLWNEEYILYPRYHKPDVYIATSPASMLPQALQRVHSTMCTMCIAHYVHIVLFKDSTFYSRLTKKLVAPSGTLPPGSLIRCFSPDTALPLHASALQHVANPTIARQSGSLCHEYTRFATLPWSMVIVTYTTTANSLHVPIGPEGPMGTIDHFVTKTSPKLLRIL